MSVTFSIADVPPDLDRPETHVNLANSNARDLLRWLQLPAEPYGEVPARELAARCRRRLWDVPRNHDPELPGELEDRVIYCGRRADYLRDRTRELLALSERAGEGVIVWS